MDGGKSSIERPQDDEKASLLDEANVADVRGGMLELCAERDSQLCSEENFGHCDLTRFTRENDLLSTEGLGKALDAAKKPGTHVMVSLPCTCGTIWTYVNEKVPGAAEKVEEERKKIYKLLRAADSVCTVATKHGWVTMELPRYNRYWASVQVRKFCAKFQLQMADLDGCAFGLTDSKGRSIRKPWRFATNCNKIYEKLNGIMCPRGHKHVIAQGAETKGTGTYPYMLAAQIHAGYRGTMCS